MTGDSVRAALSQLGDVLESLRERLGDESGQERQPDRDAHALDIFQEILSVPPLGLPPGELFGLAMDRVSRLLAADRAVLFVLDDTTGRLVPRSGRGFRRDDLESVVLDPGEGLVGRVFAEKRMLTYDAAGEPPVRDPFAERFPVRQGIAVPVRTEGEVGGVLFAGRRALGAPFSTTDVLLRLVIADRVGSEQIPPDDDLLAEGFAADRPVAIRDLQARATARPGVLERDGLRAGLLVPLRSRGRVLGLLALADVEPREFSPEEVEIALTLAAVTAGALDSRRGLEDLRQALGEQAARQAEQAEREKARVLTAFGAGLTRELSAVFALLLGKSQLML